MEPDKKTPETADKKTPEASASAPELPPLRSVHTSNFPELLQQLGASILVTTYQAGKLVILRPEKGSLNTHFRGFQVPMGLAADPRRLAIGTSMQIWEFHNTPAVTRRLEPPDRHDACYMPRKSHVTGNVQIHEMVWHGAELWFVNTRFSCLCTLDERNSFVPRWQPPFITGLAPEDRCHLNGLGLGPTQQPGTSVPRGWVTALGTTDTPGGWRQNKKSGGVLMDLPGGNILLDGLSMPHSPRWYDGRLWLLESGNGTLGFIDQRSGRYQSVAELPGFTRGLDFAGPLAFVGLSQVRETAVFSGIAISERPERACGVWVVNIHTGQTVAFVKFEDALQEIFAVQVLPGIRFPDLINDNDSLIADSFVLPDEALRLVPEAMRSPAAKT